MYEDKTNVEYEMYEHAVNNWDHRSSNKWFEEKFGSHACNTFSKLTGKDSCTWNNAQNKESATVWNLKPVWWGSQLVQEY